MNNSAESVNQPRNIRRPSENEKIKAGFEEVTKDLLTVLEVKFNQQISEILNSNEEKINYKLADLGNLDSKECFLKGLSIDFIIFPRNILTQAIENHPKISIDINKLISDHDIDAPDSYSTRLMSSYIKSKIRIFSKNITQLIGQITENTKIPYTTAKLLHSLSNQKFEYWNNKGELIFQVGLSKLITNYLSSAEFKQNAGSKYESIKLHLNSFGL